MADEIPMNESGRDDREIALCTKCLAELGPTTDFCPRCRAPVSSYAGTGPYESALAEGWAMGESVVTATPNRFTLIGLWLLFAPVCVGAVLLFIVTLREGWPGVLGGLLVMGVATLYGYCVIRGTRNYLRTRRGTGT